MASVVNKGKSFQIRVSCGYDTNGKQHLKIKTWRPVKGMTEKQIQKELERQKVLFEEACNKGHVTSNVKFETFAEEWFEEYASKNLKCTSYERMLQLRGRIYPKLGHLKMDKITTWDIQSFINDLSTKERNQKNGNALSRKTLIHYLGLISDVFTYAVRMSMVDSNPCNNVTVPKGKKKEIEYYTLDETEKLYKLLETAPLKYKAFFTLIMCSGFRRSEMLGLEWKDIDFEHCVISIYRTSNYTVGKGIYTDSTKTKCSERSLKLPKVVFDILKSYRVEQNAERDRLGTKWEDHDRLFTKWNGMPMNNGTPYFWYKEFCEKNNFRFCGIHSFRHPYVKLKLKNNSNFFKPSALIH